MLLLLCQQHHALTLYCHMTAYSIFALYALQYFSIFMYIVIRYFFPKAIQFKSLWMYVPVFENVMKTLVLFDMGLTTIEMHLCNI